MTIQEMKERKRELGLSNEEISARSGVPLPTLQKIFSGKTKAPRRQTIQALEKVLAPVQGTGRYSFEASASCTAEPPAAYAAKKQGEYTVDDYYAIPDERRVELIDGVIYDMTAPSVIHQLILAQLYLLFEKCISGHKGECEVFLSPCDVRLDNDNKTMLQPDIFILCRKYDLHAREITGAPDLTAEILSPSTRSKDMLLKLNKYHNAGVREYWIIDPVHKEVYVYNFEESDFKPEIYPFDAQIPIHISEGKCLIDFSQVLKKIAAYYDGEE